MIRDPLSDGRYTEADPAFRKAIREGEVKDGAFVQTRQDGVPLGSRDWGRDFLSFPFLSFPFLSFPFLSFPSFLPSSVLS